MEQARSSAGPLSVGALARLVGGSLILNGILPWAAYQVLTARGMDSLTALAITAVFPAVGTVFGWVRLGRPDMLGVLSLAFIGISLAVALVTDNELVILLRRSVSNAI